MLRENVGVDTEAQFVSFFKSLFSKIIIFYLPGNTSHSTNRCEITKFIHRRLSENAHAETRSSEKGARTNGTVEQKTFRGKKTTFFDLFISITLSIKNIAMHCHKI